MSQYTTEVRFICENATGLIDSTGGDSVQSIIQKAVPKIFNFEYPIFDVAYKSVLETKILKHYYTREIALETVGLWKLKLDTKMNEIMPYYNQLYKSELLKFDPLNDINLTHTHDTTANGKSLNTTIAENKTDTEGHNTRTDNITVDGKNSQTNTSNITTSVNNTTATNDTPQGQLDNVKQLKYLSAYEEKNENGTHTNTETSTGTTGNTTTGTVKNDSSGNSDSNLNSATNGSFDSTTKYLESLTGKQSSTSYSKLVLEYRETFLNIDMQVINSLSDLFFNLW